MDSGANWVSGCIICSRSHRMEEYYCDVVNCIKEKEKIRAHVTINCANCRKNDIANFPQYIPRHKADLEARKYKKRISQEEKKNFRLRM